MSSLSSDIRTILIIGASRGLGHAMAAEFLKKGWNVVGTVLETDRTMLHDLAAEFESRVEIEVLDINEPEQVAALHDRLSGRILDILFVNAGTSVVPDQHVHIGDVTTGEFVRVLVTNALSPMRLIERFADLVSTKGTIGVMSSGQGSIANNEHGGREVYRGSKAALNMFMRSYAARHTDGRSLVLMAPGWIRTELGGPDAPLGTEDSIPKVVDVILSQHGTPGLKFLDRFGAAVPW